MQTIYVQFTDSTMTTISSVFANAQSPTEFPYQETILSNDPRYAAYYATLPADFQALMIAPNS